MRAVPIEGEALDAFRRKLLGLSPALTALAYPYLLRAFHAAVTPADATSSLRILAAALLLALAFAMPLSGLALAHWQTRLAEPSQSDLRARRLAYASIAAPPLFVFLGVAPGLAGLHVSDIALWIALWLVAALYVWFGADAPERPRARPARSIAGWRVAHGISAALIACFVLFHLTNHLFGLAGPATHAAIMKAGRTVYRAPFVEPVLIALLLFQVTSGVRLAWRWSGLRTDAYRIFQIGSGAYLSAFILAHVNSALISARAVHGIETDWAWAAGLPSGLIHDAWNIRLLPHYALGAFFILGHLTSGLRMVMLAHGVKAATADRLWAAGVAGGALIAIAIISGLCGLRL
jgi:hypothetical protein